MVLKIYFYIELSSIKFFLRHAYKINIKLEESFGIWNKDHSSKEGMN